MLNTTDGEPEKAIKLAHPFGVTSRQVIIHRHQMRTTPGQSAQIERQSRDQGFAFADRHLATFAAVQDDSADELAVAVHPFPFHRLTANAAGVPALCYPP